MRDSALPVATMLPVLAASIPVQIRRDARRYATPFWREVFQPSHRDGCKFGCKVYARQQGATLRFAVFHSLMYGHSHSPSAR